MNPVPGDVWETPSVFIGQRWLMPLGFTLWVIDIRQDFINFTDENGGWGQKPRLEFVRYMRTLGYRPDGLANPIDGDVWETPSGKRRTVQSCERDTLHLRVVYTTGNGRQHATPVQRWQTWVAETGARLVRN